MQQQPGSSEAMWFWFLWAVRGLTGVGNLDGDETEDGYSLDGMYDSWTQGDTPEYAAGMVLNGIGFAANAEAYPA